MGTGGIFSQPDVVITSEGEGKWSKRGEDSKGKRYIGRKGRSETKIGERMMMENSSSQLYLHK